VGHIRAPFLPEDGRDVARLAQEFRETGVAVRGERGPQLAHNLHCVTNRLW